MTPTEERIAKEAFARLLLHANAINFAELAMLRACKSGKYKFEALPEDLRRRFLDIGMASVAVNL